MLIIQENEVSTGTFHSETINKCMVSIRTAFALPPSCIWRNWSHVQLVSSCVDRTNVTCTPRLLCTAEQSIQINTPYVTLAQVGFLALQSKHTCNEDHNIYYSFQITSHLLDVVQNQNIIIANLPLKMWKSSNIWEYQ